MEYLLKDFGKILKKNFSDQRVFFSQLGSNCMRVYDRNIGALPLSVDIYADYARITDYREDPDFVEEIMAVVASMVYIHPEKVIYHARNKREGKEQHTIQSEQALHVTVLEQELSFTVDLTTRIDTGLFLDHALTRAMVREECLGLRVLNLFCYTGSFSVYAAAGGAKEVVSVDLSGNYLEWAKKNLAANGFTSETYPCIQQDVRKYLEEAVERRETFDLIIIDPPSFSNSRKMEGVFDVQRDYVFLLTMAGKCLTKKGSIVFSTNLTGFHFDTGRLPGFQTEEITMQTIPPGFSQKKKPHRAWVLRIRTSAGQRNTQSPHSRAQYKGKNSNRETNRPITQFKHKRKR